MTDRDLQTNPIDAFVRERIHYRVDTLIGKFGFTESDREDLQQELIVAVLEAMPNFDPAKSSRRTFVRNVLDRRRIDLVRKQQAAMRDCGRNGFSLAECESTEDLYDGAERRRRGIGLSDHQRVDLAEGLPVVLGRLPERQRRICELMSKLSVAGVATRMGISQSTVRRDLREIRRVLIAEGFGEFVGGR